MKKGWVDDEADFFLRRQDFFLSREKQYFWDRKYAIERKQRMTDASSGLNWFRVRLSEEQEGPWWGERRINIIILYSIYEM